MNKKPQETKATVCCTVRLRYKKAILAYVNTKDESLASLMGKVLEDWVDIVGLLKLVEPVTNEDQDELDFK